MKTLLFEGPSAFLVPEPEADPVPRGEPFTCSDERAEEHLTSPHYRCSEVGDLADKTRSELDKLAAEAGVEDPGSLRTKDDVIEAIAAVETKEPEAAEGEGPDTNSDKEE